MSKLTEAELHDLVQNVVARTLQNEPVQVTDRIDETVTPEKKDVKGVRVIALGADHGGYQLKEIIKAHLQGQGMQVDDVGTHNSDAVDYPDIAFAVANKVSKKEVCCGIIIDGAGIGSCMVANKVAGVRAALCYDYATAVNSRKHNHANVLTLGAGLIGTNLAKQIVDAFLNTKFGDGRHARRVEMIMKIEKEASA